MQRASYRLPPLKAGRVALGANGPAKLPLRGGRGRGEALQGLANLAKEYTSWALYEFCQFARYGRRQRPERTYQAS